VFSVDQKVFPLSDFSNGKQIQESLESGFPESEFRKKNKHGLKRKGARQWHCGCNSIITDLPQDQIIIILAYRGKRWYFLFF